MKVIALGFCRLAGLLLLTFSPQVYAARVWTNSLSGFWQDGTNWLEQTAPASTSSVLITNDITKTITINELTPSTNLTIVRLLLNAPPGATNTLLLSNVGTTNPLTMTTGLELQSGAAIGITNSALLCQLTNDHVNIDGTLALDSGSIDFGDTTVTARVGRVTSGILTINGGLVSAGTVTVGGLTNSTGAVNITGGQLNVSSLLSVGRNPGTTGAVFMVGGQLTVPNDDTQVGDGGVGQITISNATAILTNLNVGQDIFSIGTVTIQNGGLLIMSNDISVAVSSQSTGMVFVTGGQIAAAGQKIKLGRQGAGQFTLVAGIVQARDLWICPDPTNIAGGVFAMTGGRLSLASSLLVGSLSNSAGQFSASGGDIEVSNSTATAILTVPNGSVTLAGGTLATDNLVLTNATGQFVFNSGTLNTKATTVANGSSFVVGDSSNTATLYLNGGTHYFVDGLIISSNATLAGCGSIVGSITNYGLIATSCSPVANFSGSPTSGLRPLAVSFTDNSTGTIINRFWDFGDGSITNTTLTSFTHTYTGVGTNTVVLTVSGPVGTNTQTRAGYIVVTNLPPPSLSLSPRNLNFGTLIVGQASTQSFQIVNSGGMTLTGNVATTLPFAIQSGTPFSLAAGQTGQVQVSFSPTSAGSISNVVIFTSNGGNSTNPVTGTGAVVPVASFSGSPTSGLRPLAVTFTDNSTGTITNRFWDFGDGSTTNSTLTSLSHTYAAAGTNTVVLTVSGPVGTNIQTRAGYIVVLQASTGFTITFQSRVAMTNTISFQSMTGSVYTLQFKNFLSDTNWTDVLPSTNGTGNLILLRDTTANRTSRLYRVRRQ